MPKLLTTSDAGTLLGVTGTRVRAMVAAGQLKATLFGKTYLIAEKDLDAVRDRRPGRPAGKADAK
jgi:excisionase family DNA binding protein